MRQFNDLKRIVVKVGTNVLAGSEGVDTGVITRLAREISELVRSGHQVILVTSGAIGMGARSLGIRNKVNDVKKRQALAAVGQGILMHEYQKAFERYDQKVAQVLLTNRIMSGRKSYVNLKDAMDTLLNMGIVPIVNENDCVSIDEIDLAFGDNDRLSALVASKIDAELLILLTDVEGLYDGNPKRNRNAKLISEVYEITDEIRAMAGRAGSTFGTGGMTSKLGAIEIAAQAGCKVVLASGLKPNVIRTIMAGEIEGTLFLPKRRLSNRKRWILNSIEAGRIEVDAGAAEAVRKRRKSLLAVGITEVQGHFKAGDVVRVGEFAKGIIDIGAGELRELLSKHRSGERGGGKGKAVIHADNVVLLNG